MKRPAKPHWSDSAEYRRYARHFLKEVVPKLKGSAVSMVIAPRGGMEDVKIATEIGYAILLDKPLFVIVPETGRVVAPKLLRIADAVVEGDLTTDAGRALVEAKLKAVLSQ